MSNVTVVGTKHVGAHQNHKPTKQEKKKRRKPTEKKREGGALL